MSKRRQKKGFTLIELLTVISITGMLLAILLPALREVRLRAKVMVVNAELSNISLALEAFALFNKGAYPPTRADCNVDTIKHYWSLPKELASDGYLSLGRSGQAEFAVIDDKFNGGCTYKYVAVGKRYDFTGTPGVQMLQVPKGFPENPTDKYVLYSDPAKSPVTWCLFSLGPNFDENNSVLDGYPVAKQFWYQPGKRSGLVMRTRLQSGRQIGTFEGR